MFAGRLARLRYVMLFTPSPPTSCAPAPPAPPTAGARPHFERLLHRELGRPLQVVWTQNRVRLASCRRRATTYVVRLHYAFARGGPAEARLLVDLLVRRTPGASGPLRAWFARVQAETEPAEPQGSTLRPRPKPGPNLRPQLRGPVVTDGIAPAAHVSPEPKEPVDLGAPAEGARALLSALFTELNAAFFHNRCQASIRWGRATRPGRRRRRSMQLGCYDFVRREIRIHPALGASFVPRYVVALVVYHEMLHEVFGLTEKGGRRCAHPPEFAVCEQGHPDYARARGWEAAHIGRLLAWRA